MPSTAKDKVAAANAARASEDRLTVPNLNLKGSTSSTGSKQQISSPSSPPVNMSPEIDAPSASSKGDGKKKKLDIKSRIKKFFTPRGRSVSKSDNIKPTKSTSDMLQAQNEDTAPSTLSSTRAISMSHECVFTEELPSPGKQNASHYKSMEFLSQTFAADLNKKIQLGKPSKSQPSKLTATSNEGLAARSSSQNLDASQNDKVEDEINAAVIEQTFFQPWTNTTASTVPILSRSDSEGASVVALDSFDQLNSSTSKSLVSSSQKSRLDVRQKNRRPVTVVGGQKLRAKSGADLLISEALTEETDADAFSPPSTAGSMPVSAPVVAVSSTFPKFTSQLSAPSAVTSEVKQHRFQKRVSNSAKNEPSLSLPVESIDDKLLVSDNVTMSVLTVDDYLSDNQFDSLKSNESSTDVEVAKHSLSDINLSLSSDKLSLQPSSISPVFLLDLSASPVRELSSPDGSLPAVIVGAITNIPERESIKNNETKVPITKISVKKPPPTAVKPSLDSQTSNTSVTTSDKKSSGISFKGIKVLPMPSSSSSFEAQATADGSSVSTDSVLSPAVPHASNLVIPRVQLANRSLSPSTPAEEQMVLNDGDKDTKLVESNVSTASGTPSVVLIPRASLNKHHNKNEEAIRPNALILKVNSVEENRNDSPSSPGYSKSIISDNNIALALENASKVLEDNKPLKPSQLLSQRGINRNPEVASKRLNATGDKVYSSKSNRNSYIEREEGNEREDVKNKQELSQAFKRFQTNKEASSKSLEQTSDKENEQAVIESEKKSSMVERNRSVEKSDDNTVKPCAPIVASKPPRTNLPPKPTSGVTRGGVLGQTWAPGDRVVGKDSDMKEKIPVLRRTAQTVDDGGVKNVSSENQSDKSDEVKTSQPAISLTVGPAESSSSQQINETIREDPSIMNKGSISARRGNSLKQQLPVYSKEDAFAVPKEQTKPEELLAKATALKKPVAIKAASLRRSDGNAAVGILNQMAAEASSNEIKMQKRNGESTTIVKVNDNAKSDVVKVEQSVLSSISNENDQNKFLALKGGSLRRTDGSAALRYLEKMSSVDNKTNEPVPAQELTKVEESKTVSPSNGVAVSIAKSETDLKMIARYEKTNDAVGTRSGQLDTTAGQLPVSGRLVLKGGSLRRTDSASATKILDKMNKETADRTITAEKPTTPFEPPCRATDLQTKLGEVKNKPNEVQNKSLEEIKTIAPSNGVTASVVKSEIDQMMKTRYEKSENEAVRTLEKEIKIGNKGNDAAAGTRAEQSDSASQLTVSGRLALKGGSLRRTDGASATKILDKMNKETADRTNTTATSNEVQNKSVDLQTKASEMQTKSDEVQNKTFQATSNAPFIRSGSTKPKTVIADEEPSWLSKARSNSDKWSKRGLDKPDNDEESSNTAEMPRGDRGTSAVAESVVI